MDASTNILCQTKEVNCWIIKPPMEDGVEVDAWARRK